MKFLQLINAIEENNRMNDVDWSTWEDAKHVQEVYGDLSEDTRELNRLAETFINALIRTSGDGVKEFSMAFDLVEYGILFARPGINT